jgi:hypothetical protein
MPLRIGGKVRAMPAVERRGLRMSLPDRHLRPHTFQDDALSALVENIPSLKSWANSRVVRCWLAIAAEPTKTEMPITLVLQDLSAIGYVETSAYLNWVQAVVIKHWERFAPEAAQASTL